MSVPRSSLMLLVATLLIALVAALLAAAAPATATSTATFASAIDCPVWNNPLRAPPNFTVGSFNVSVPNAVYPISVITAVLNTISSSNTQTLVIALAPGTYNGSLTITKPNVMFVGCGASYTYITHSVADNLNVGTVVSSAVNVTFEHVHISNRWHDPWQVGPNPPNPPTGTRTQAVAVVINADFFTLRYCYLYGYQDTLYSRRGRAYIFNTTILGSVDFIFGQGVMYLDRCRIEAIPGGYISAPSTFPTMPHGIVFQSCNVVYNTSFVKSTNLTVGLGRGWSNFPMATFIDTTIESATRFELLAWSQTGGNSIYDNTSASACHSRFAEYGTRFADGTTQDWINMRKYSCPLYGNSSYPWVVPIIAEATLPANLTAFYAKSYVLTGWDPVDETNPPPFTPIPSGTTGGDPSA